MTLTEFKAAREQDLNGALLALWWDAQGSWDRAHDVAQEMEDIHGSWVHAYLHRKEGDLENAAYWYRRAGRRPAQGDFDQEWSAIAATLLTED